MKGVTGSACWAAPAASWPTSPRWRRAWTGPASTWTPPCGGTCRSPAAEVGWTSVLSRHCCTAGEDCCLAAREGPAGWECGEGAGDCGRDAHCAGTLVSSPLCTVHYCRHQVCGRDNCQSEFGHTGQFWDEGDDCCERACTPQHPCRWTLQHCSTVALDCREGAGHCTADSDCSNPGWALCGYQNCLNPQYFPTNLASSNFLDTIKLQCKDY